MDPATMSMHDAVRYVLSIRTNVVLIVASSLAYFFFTGLQTSPSSSYAGVSVSASRWPAHWWSSSAPARSSECSSAAVSPTSWSVAG